MLDSKEADMPSLAKVVQKAIKSEVEKIVLEEADAAAKRVKARVSDMTAIFATRVLERYTMERFGSTLRIEVNLNEYGKQ